MIMIVERGFENMWPWSNLKCCISICGVGWWKQRA